MMQSPDGLSDAICSHIATISYNQLPETTRVATSRALLDGVGVMLAASGISGEVKPFLGIAAGTPGPIKVLGTSLKTAPAFAALANGAAAHALDFEDAFDGSPCHPNAALLAAALAVAQMGNGVSGKDFIAAMAAGCDLTCRLSLALRKSMEEGGWYPPPILGAMGATAAAARLLSLTPEEVKSALSLTLCQAVMPGEIKNSKQTIIRAVREAFPAQAAVMSVLLAKDGVTGFETPIEGESGFYALYADGTYEPADILSGLGEKFYIDDLSFKRWPACRGTHAYIEGALTLLHDNHLSWQDIETIEIVSGPVQKMLLEPAPRKQAPITAIDAKFSIPFTVAAACVRGDVTLNDFDTVSLTDPDILSVAARVTATYDAAISPHGGDISITDTSGKTYTSRIAAAQGHPSNPLSTAQLQKKFTACAALASQPVTGDAVTQLIGALLSLDTFEDCNDLFSTL